LPHQSLNLSIPIGSTSLSTETVESDAAQSSLVLILQQKKTSAENKKAACKRLNKDFL